MLFPWHNPKFRVLATWISAFALGVNLPTVFLLRDPYAWWTRVASLVILALVNGALLLAQFLPPPEAVAGDSASRAEPGDPPDRGGT